MDKLRLCEIEVLAAELDAERQQTWLRDLLSSGHVGPATVINTTLPHMTHGIHQRNGGPYNGSLEAIVSTHLTRSDGALATMPLVSEIVDGSRGTCAPAYALSSGSLQDQAPRLDLEMVSALPLDGRNLVHSD